MQWLIDLVTERVKAEIGIPPVFIDRGDPATYDFAEGDLDDDAAWHDLDISSIVPAGASGIAFRFQFRGTTASSIARFRVAGHSDVVAVAQVTTGVTGVTHNHNIPLPISSDRKFSYWMSSGKFTIKKISIYGYWL